MQLFNAVRKQQKTVEDELEMAGSDRKKEKVMEKITKHKFLSMLKGSSVSNVEVEKKDSKEKVTGPKHDKTYRITGIPSVDSDHPAYQGNLIRAFAVGM